MKLQLPHCKGKGGGDNAPNVSVGSVSSFSDQSTINLISHDLPLGVQSTEQYPPIINLYDPLMTSPSFNSSRTVEGPMLADLRGARLAIETDISIADFPTATSCLNNIQFIPSVVSGIRDYFRIASSFSNKMYKYKHMFYL